MNLVPTRIKIIKKENKIKIIYDLKEPPTRASSVGGLLLDDKRIITTKNPIFNILWSLAPSIQVPWSKIH